MLTYHNKDITYIHCLFSSEVSANLNNQNDIIINLILMETEARRILLRQLIVITVLSDGAC